eukprot:1017191_1
MASIAPANNHVTLDPSISPVQSITARHPTVGDIQEAEVREITTLTPQQTDDEHHEQSDNSHKSLSALTYWVPVYVSLAVMLACVECVVMKERELVDGNGVHKQVAVVQNQTLV